MSEGAIPISRPLTADEILAIISLNGLTTTGITGSIIFTKPGTTARTFTYQDRPGTVALRDAGTTDGIFDWSNPNAITAAATAIVGRVNVCSGTTADYTVLVPTPVGIAGQCIALVVDRACNRLITFSAAAGTLGGASTRIGWTGESFILRSDGTQWERIGGTHRPMAIAMRRQVPQSITQLTWTQIVMNTVVYDTTSSLAVPCADMTNGRFKVLRPGIYSANGYVSIGGMVAGVEVNGGVGLNSAAPEDNPNAWMTVAAPSSGFAQLSGAGVFNATAGQWIGTVINQGDTATRDTRAVATTYPSLSVTEIPSW